MKDNLNFAIKLNLNKHNENNVEPFYSEVFLPAFRSLRIAFCALL